LRIWEDCVDDTEDQDDSLLGADEDEHGCIGSAGYQWCTNLDDCLRPFELDGDWNDICDSSTESPISENDSSSSSDDGFWDLLGGDDDSNDYAVSDMLDDIQDTIDEAVNQSIIDIEDLNDENDESCSFGWTWCDAQSECLRIWEDCVDDTEDQDDSLLGADEDEHGCIGSAGYQWCTNLDDCLRPFELDGDWNDICDSSTESPISENDSSSSSDDGFLDDLLDSIVDSDSPLDILEEAEDLIGEALNQSGIDIDAIVGDGLNQSIIDTDNLLGEGLNQSVIDTDNFLGEGLNQSVIDTDNLLGEGIDTDNLLGEVLDPDNLLGGVDVEGVVDDVLQNLGGDKDEEETSAKVDISTSVDDSSSSFDEYGEKDDCNKESSWCKGCSKNFFKTKIFIAIVILTCLIAACLCWRLRRNRTRAKLATKLDMISGNAPTKEGECLVETTARKEGESTSGTETTTNPDINKLGTLL